MQQSSMAKVDKLRIIERCLDDGAKQVDGTIQFATSADQRAIILASTYITAATALIAGMVAWAADHTIPQNLLWSGIAAAFLFYTGALICIYTAFPQITFTGGNPPPFWQWHLENTSSYEVALESQISEYEKKIKSNGLLLAKAAKWFRFGGFIGASAPLIALIVYWVSDCFLSTV